MHNIDIDQLQIDKASVENLILTELRAFNNRYNRQLKITSIGIVRTQGDDIIDVAIKIELPW